MTESILALVPTYGLPFLFGIAVLAAAGIPVPSSMAVLAVGAFVAVGDLDFLASYLTALSGAVIGDQIGFQIGMHAGNSVERRLNPKKAYAQQILKAKRFIDRFGGTGVFLTRWLLAPIGPATNIVCGASDMRWLRFTLWDLAGEIVWAAIYIGLGYTLRDNIEAVATVIGDASWLFIAMLVVGILGYRMVVALKKHRQNQERAE